MDQIPAAAPKAHRTEKGKGKAQPELRGKNPKAFGSQSARNANKQARRNADLDQRRLHVPAIDRTFGGHGTLATANAAAGPSSDPLDMGAPPVIVAVMGPPGVGKTTLVRSLVRRYTKTTMPHVTGPVTVVSGKLRRLTFVECPNDIGGTVDLAKVADLVLVMIDGSFGFEMDTFEAISAMQTHGMPKLIGVLTHLDLIRKPEQAKAQKKRLKQRFWTEVYDGAKLFYLSGVWNGRYPDREILNLSRFINVAKFRPLTFRNAHPYLLADRFEDVTPPELVRTQPKADRTIALCGYLRGIPLRPPRSADHPIRVHIPGAGVDALDVTQLTPLPDPCPLPTKEGEKRRRMSDKHRLVHAPMSGGAGTTGVSFDGDRLWITTQGTFTRRDPTEAGPDDAIVPGEGERMVMDLHDARDSLGEGLARSEIRLLKGSAGPLQAPDDEQLSDLDDDDADEDDDVALDLPVRAPRSGQRSALDGFGDGGGKAGPSRVAYAGSDDEDALDLAEGEFEADSGDEDDLDLPDDAEDDDDEPRWKLDLSARAANAFSSFAAKRKLDLAKLIYASDMSVDEIVAEQRGEREETAAGEGAMAVDENEDDLFVVKATTARVSAEDRFRTPITPIATADLDSFRYLFITGDDVHTSTRADDDAEAADGDFEDLEADAAPAAPAADALAAKKAALKRKFDQQYDGDSDDEAADATGGDAPERDFYDQQKEAMAGRVAATQAEFADDDLESRARVQGYRPGTYVRMILERVPCELVDRFDPHFPLIVGGLLAHEEAFGYIQVRIKKHRWHTKVLKTNDPLILSVGWRRFQTVPVYSLDDGTRNRMLKYTPEHMHCLATFWGPVGGAPGTGVLAFNTLSAKTPGFRVSATGVVVDVDGGSRIVKKLKLTATPYKIFKNTAFLRDMFTSALEVAKFEGARLRTVSGVRGQIKKALSKPEGAFRAAFEDRILMSDLVFLRAWHVVQPRRFYNPVDALLLEDKSSWAGMRLTGAVRYEQGLSAPSKSNSHYQPVERETRRFNPLKIPRKLQAALPYASKPREQTAQKKPTYLQKRAVVMDEDERKAVGLLQQIQAIEKGKLAKRAAKKKEDNAKRLKVAIKSGAKRAEREKAEKREHFREVGLKSKRDDAAAAKRARPAKRQKRGGNDD